MLTGKLALASAIAIGIIMSFISLMPKKQAQATYLIDKAVWHAEGSNLPIPIKVGLSLDTIVPHLPNCCHGQYHLTIPPEALFTANGGERFQTPALYIPALSCGQSVRIGSRVYPANDSEYTSTGPVIPIALPLVSGQSIAVEVDVNCPAVDITGMWKGPIQVGEYFALAHQQKADRNFQKYMPLISSCLFILLAFGFLMVYLFTDRQFKLYFNVSLGLSLWTTSLFFLSGIPRQIDITWGTILHYPVRILAAGGIFLIISYYRAMFSSRTPPWEKRATKISIASLSVLCIAAIISSATSHHEATAVFTIIAAVGIYWQLWLWPIAELKILSSGFIAFTVSLMSFFGSASDALQVWVVMLGYDYPIAYLQRYTANLFMAVAVALFFRHFIKLYKKLHEDSVRTAKAMAVNRTIKMVAHDVRKPFSTILIGLQVLERNAKETPLINDAFKLVKNECQKSLSRVNSMLRDVMDYGHAVQLRPSWVTPIEFVDEVIEEIQARYAERAVIIHKQVSYQNRVFLDSDRIYRVLVNILDNAVQATPNGGQVTLSLQASQHQQKNGVLFTANNTGSFIDAEKRDLVFKDFYTEGKSQGTGLGLAIAKDFVDAHLGYITCESSLATGTSFLVWLPLPEC